MRLEDSQVGLDARLWDHPGMGRYLRELFFAMRRRKEAPRFSLLIKEKFRRELQAIQSDVSFKNAYSPIYSIPEQLELISFSQKKDLLHVPHFNIPFTGAKRLVVTVHDLIYLKGNEHTGSSIGRAYVKFLFKRVEKKADAVITVSEFTKNDLLQSFPGLKGKVFVTYEAVSPWFQPAGLTEAVSVKKKYGIQGPFVLFVGSLKRHKNLPVLIEAMQILKEEKGIDHDLVLAGRKDPKEKELLRLIEKNGSFIRCLGEVPDQDLIHLYSSAEAMVLPSLWEGFGLPVLEAMACGAPVLSSNRASLPEVVGDAGALFDPTRVDALAELLYTVLKNSDLRKNMRSMGFLQAKKFSWDTTAAQTLRVYGQVVG